MAKTPNIRHIKNGKSLSLKNHIVFAHNVDVCQPIFIFFADTYASSAIIQ